MQIRIINVSEYKSKTQKLHGIYLLNLRTTNTKIIKVPNLN